VGRTGHEPRDQLDADTELKARLERIRLAAGPLMNLGDVTTKVVPKIALVAAPQAGGAIATRSFIPHECHASIGVFAAVTVATAAALPGSPAASVSAMRAGRERSISVEHPTGEFTVSLTVGGTADRPVIERAGLLRTARILMDGLAYVPETALVAAPLSAAAE
jgi:4-oxalomesaconate tautomerase